MNDQHKGLSDNTTAHFDFFSFCDNYEEGVYVWAFFSNLSFAVGFPASVAVLWELFKTCRRNPLTPNDFLILNLSIMDALFLTSIPVGVINNFWVKSMEFQIAWTGFYALNTCGRPLLMACVCLDCYVAVVHPIIYHQRKSLLPRVVMVAVVWTLTLACGIAYALFTTVFNTPFPAVGFLTGLVVIVICNGFIIHSIVKSDQGRRNIHPQKQRAIQTLVSSLLMIVVCYIPVIFTYTLAILLINNQQVVRCTIAYPAMSTSTLTSALMPLLSLYNIGKFQCIKHACCNI